MDGDDTFLAMDHFVPVLVSESLMLSQFLPSSPRSGSRKTQPQLISESVASRTKGDIMCVNSGDYHVCCGDYHVC